MSELLGAGAEAQAFALTNRDGTPLTFGDRDPAAPATLLFFFRYDCATCDLTAPLVERLHGTLAAEGLRVVGVSQDASAETTSFVDRHGLSFALALDTKLDVSADYGFDAVPALVLASAGRQVLFSFEGFVKRDLLELTRRAAAACGAATPETVQDEDQLPEHRPGCGSKVHDPNVARRMAVRRGAATLGARRVRVPSGDDPFEFMGFS